jgi:hypothetical protein
MVHDRKSRPFMKTARPFAEKARPFTKMTFFSKNLLTAYYFQDYPNPRKRLRKRLRIRHGDDKVPDKDGDFVTPCLFRLKPLWVKYFLEES